MSKKIWSIVVALIIVVLTLVAIHFINSEFWRHVVAWLGGAVAGVVRSQIART